MEKTLLFIVFCMESYKNHRNLTGQEVYALFQRYGVIDYLREFYDVLHTAGEPYINEDIDRYLENRRHDENTPRR